jgi:hypothetical protein
MIVINLTILYLTQKLVIRQIFKHTLGFNEDKTNQITEENYNDLNLTNIYCMKPDLSYADEIAKKYMNSESKMPECQDIENFVTLSDENSNDGYRIKLNVKNILSKYNITENHLSCKLNLFDKTYNISRYFKVNWFSETKFEKRNNYLIEIFKHGFYYLNCYKRENRTEILIFDDTYSILPNNISKLIDEKKLFGNYFSIKSDEQKIKFHDKINSEKIGLEKMSVLIIGMDSMSYPQFERSMPQTFNYLKNELKNNIMYSSMRTVGENTVPNSLAYLAGVSFEGIQSESVKINPEKQNYEKEKYGPLEFEFAEKYPFIWNEYEKAGYITGYQVNLLI